MVYSTGECDSLTIEENTMITESEVRSFLKDRTKSELKAILLDKNIKFKSSASKDQIIADFVNFVLGKDAFKKKLFSLYGGSGGYISLACTHGIAYGFKAIIKHESPSDYVDLILSLKYKPAILVCDMPDRIAKNLKKRAPQFLRPYNGMFVEPTDTNIALANKNNLKINLDSNVHREYSSKNLDHTNENDNPITNTGQSLEVN